MTKYHCFTYHLSAFIWITRPLPSTSLKLPTSSYYLLNLLTLLSFSLFYTLSPRMPSSTLLASLIAIFSSPVNSILTVQQGRGALGGGAGARELRGRGGERVKKGKDAERESIASLELYIWA
jgi:hypothetical protein